MRHPRALGCQRRLVPHDWSIDTEFRSQATNRPQRDQSIAKLAANQKHLVRWEQLRGVGLSPNGIEYRTRSGRLFRVHRGVYALHPPPYAPHQRWLAAVLACGPGSLLSDWPAAALWGFLESPPLTAHVTNTTGRGRGYDGIVLHRRSIDPRDATRRHGIPCTSPARLIVDLAPTTTLTQLEDLLLATDAAQLLKRRRLDELLDERQGQPGTAKIRTMISGDPVLTRSRNERRVLGICREFAVPPPQVNHRIELGERTFYADFCWPELHLIVEADSWRWHGGRTANERDRDRDQLLSVAGWQVVHFTRDQIVHKRAQTGHRLRALTQEAMP